MATIAKQPARNRRVQPHLQLVELRLNAGLSRADLGLRIGVSREAIRNAELGFTPSVRVQFALARAFNRSVLDLWPLERQKVASCPRV